MSYVSQIFQGKKNRIFLSVFISLILLSFVFVLFFQKRKEEVEESKKSDFVAVEYKTDENSDARFHDSDGDGIYDWKERLLGLDPHKVDSDGDGVSDGDYLRSKELIGNKNRSGQGHQVTPSERLGKNLYTALYVAAMAGDGKISEETKEKLENTVQDYIKKLNFSTKIYTEESLSVVEDTKENDFAYEKKMKQLFKKYPIKMSEFKLLLVAIKEPQKYRSEIDQAVLKYDEYLHELEKVQVPGILVRRHLQLMNTLSKLKTGLAAVVDHSQDELISLAAASQVQGMIDDAIESITKIQQFFSLIHEDGIFS